MLINLAKDYCCYFPNEPPEWSSSLLDIYVIDDVKFDKHLTSTSPRNEPVRLINPTRRVHNGSRLIVELYSNINRFNNIQGFPCIHFFSDKVNRDTNYSEEVILLNEARYLIFISCH